MADRNTDDQGRRAQAPGPKHLKTGPQATASRLRKGARQAANGARQAGQHVARTAQQAANGARQAGQHVARTARQAAQAAPAVGQQAAKMATELTDRAKAEVEEQRRLVRRRIAAERLAGKKDHNAVNRYYAHVWGDIVAGGNADWVMSGGEDYFMEPEPPEMPRRIEAEREARYRHEAEMYRKARMESPMRFRDLYRGFRGYLSLRLNDPALAAEIASQRRQGRADARAIRQKDRCQERLEHFAKLESRAVAAGDVQAIEVAREGIESVYKGQYGRVPLTPESAASIYLKYGRMAAQTALTDPEAAAEQWRRYKSNFSRACIRDGVDMDRMWKCASVQYEHISRHRPGLVLERYFDLDEQGRPISRAEGVQREAEAGDARLPGAASAPEPAYEDGEGPVPTGTVQMEAASAVAKTFVDNVKAYVAEAANMGAIEEGIAQEVADMAPYLSGEAGEQFVAQMRKRLGNDRDRDLVSEWETKAMDTNRYCRSLNGFRLRYASPSDGGSRPDVAEADVRPVNVADYSATLLAGVMDGMRALTEDPDTAQMMAGSGLDPARVRASALELADRLALPQSPYDTAKEGRFEVLGPVWGQKEKEAADKAIDEEAERVAEAERAAEEGRKKGEGPTVAKEPPQPRRRAAKPARDYSSSLVGATGPDDEEEEEEPTPEEPKKEGPAPRPRRRRGNIKPEPEPKPEPEQEEDGREDEGGDVAHMSPTVLHQFKEAQAERQEGQDEAPKASGPQPSPQKEGPASFPDI